MPSLLINAAILSDTALSGPSLQSYQTQYNKIVQNNTLTYRLGSTNAYLNIPVYEYGFDHTYKIISEFQYNDNYQYKDSIFVLNSNITPNLLRSNYKKSEY